ncbi:MAG TPA: hypothetical protein VD767_09100 [Thermomicrobiales bacterium]|nr:hypothetical protein [Thermomicrobiales bacterium]
MDRMSLAVPAARTIGLVVTDTAGEFLVYDQEAYHIHHLNQASAVVWRLCTGDRTVLDIAIDSGLEVESVQIAIGKLAAANLLDGDASIAPQACRSTRRSFLGKTGLAVAMPTIVSVTAPLAAHAATMTSRYYKCSNESCAGGLYCPLQCTASNICPGCTKTEDYVCQVFDQGSAVPPMCGVFCNCP